MDLQKAIDAIGNNQKGESVEVTVGAPSGGAESPAGAASGGEAVPANVGIGSMDDSVSASINQAISNVGMNSEGTAGVPEMPAAGAETVPVGGAMPVQETAASVNETAVPVEASTTPEVGGDFQSVRKEAIDALLPVLGQAELDASEKFGIYEEVATGGNRDQAVISGMVAAAKEIPDEKEKARALLSAIRIIDGK